MTVNSREPTVGESRELVRGNLYMVALGLFVHSTVEPAFCLVLGIEVPASRKHRHLPGNRWDN